MVDFRASADAIALPKCWLFHHIGYAAKNMTEEQGLFKSMGYVLEGEPFVDPLQGVRGCFLNGGGPRIELLENLDGAQTLTPWLNSGVKFYHLAYEVPEMQAVIDWVRLSRGRLTVKPVPAVAFGGRKICFALFRANILLEFIEMDQGGTAYE